MEKPYVHISNKDQTAKKCFQASRDTELQQGMILIQPENIFHIQAVSIKADAYTYKTIYIFLDIFRKY